MARKRKTDRATDIVDEIYLTRTRERWMDLIANTEREVAKILSDFDPMWSENLFAQLREAIVARNPQKVYEILDEKFYHHFREKMTAALEKLLDLRAVINSEPLVYTDEDKNDE